MVWTRRAESLPRDSLASGARRLGTLIAAVAGTLSLLVVLGGRAQGAGERRVLDVPIGTARQVRIGAAVSRVSVARKEVADVAAFPPDEILLTGKHVGETEVTIWGRSGEVYTTYLVRVGLPVDGLRDRLRSLFPGQKIEVSSLGSSVVLSGKVSDAMTSGEVERVATGYYGSLGSSSSPVAVTNLLEVEGASQVQLEVRFAEVSRTALRQIGLNAWVRSGGVNPGPNDFAGGLVSPANGVSGLAPDVGSGLQLPSGLPVLTNPIEGTFSLLFASTLGSDFPITATLSLLSSRGFAKTLAEPTLVALSGQEASFLAGGEFPVPLPQALGQVVIEYKKFGIQLKFVPFVLGDETIQLKLQTVVSDVDFSLGIRLASITVPGLTQRESSTTVRLRDGQSFAIAGLLADRLRSSVDKLPFLGDLPILGMLFRSVSFRHEETELLVVVTARLVKPFARGEAIPLPGEDEVSDPSDLELFLLGIGESHSAPPGRPTGKVGFMR
jgi:pilus assembly protein CpaC